jgi:YVTN family beta-propeller protein
VFPGDHPGGFPDPTDLAWDAHDGTPLVAESDGVLAVFNNSTGLIHESFLGGPFGGIAVDPLSGHVFLSEPTTNRVLALAGGTGKLLGNLTVGASPVGVAYDPVTHEIYVANANSSNVSIIAPSTNRVIGTLSTGAGPKWLAADSRNGRLFVSDAARCTGNFTKCNVTVVEPSNGTIVATVGFANATGRLAFDNASDAMAVILPTAVRVVLINATTNLVVRSISVNYHIHGELAGGVAFDSATDELYVSTSFNLVDLNATNYAVAHDSIPTFEALQLALDSSRGELFVTESTSVFGGATPSLYTYAIPTHAFGPTVPTFDTPGATACCSPTGRLYVVDESSGRIDEVAPATGRILSTWPGVTGFALVADPAHDHLFVTQGRDIAVYNMTTHGLTEQISAPSGAKYTLTYDPSAERLYAGAPSTADITVYNVSTNVTVTTIHVTLRGQRGATIQTLLIDPSDGVLFADASVFSGQTTSVSKVSRISLATDTPMAHATLPTFAEGLALDPYTHQLYVGIVDKENFAPHAPLVDVLNAGSLSNVTTINLTSNGGGDPLTLVWSSNANAVFVASGTVGELWELDPSTHAVVAGVLVGQLPTAIVSDASNGTLWLPESSSGTVSDVRV